MRPTLFKNLSDTHFRLRLNVEPDLSVLDKKYEKDLTAKYGEIDSKYGIKILAELNDYMLNISAKKQENFNSQLDEYKTELDDRLDSDFINNFDKDVCKAYQSEIARLIAPIEPERKQRLGSICAKIDQIRRLKLYTAEKDKQINALHGEQSALNAEYDTRFKAKVYSCCKVLREREKHRL